MFNKQTFGQLEKLLGKMSPAQKEKLIGIMKDEESLKKAISSIDPQKAKQAVKDLHINGVKNEDLEKMAEEITKNPDKIKDIQK